MIIREFQDRDAASRAAAERLAAELGAALRSLPSAGLMVSGGSTPQACLGELACLPLPWHRVVVLPTDERCVPEHHPASNAAMIRRCLLRSEAASATLLPLTQDSLARIDGRLAAALVGMGEDGHFASIFPDADNLDGLLCVDGPAACERVATAASEFPRITANLALLLSARRVVLLAFGERKKARLRQPEGLPIERLLNQTRAPVEICWAL